MTNNIVDQIRNTFNNPAKSGTSGKGCHYCVGGAFLLYRNNLSPEDARYTQHRFPDPEYLADELHQANPNLTSGLAREFAELITDYNDMGDFKTAWSKLELALNFGKEENAQ